MATLPELLKTMVEMDGSDLHIATNTPPQIRVNGRLAPLQHFEGTLNSGLVTDDGGARVAREFLLDGFAAAKPSVFCFSATRRMR